MMKEEVSMFDRIITIPLCIVIVVLLSYWIGVWSGLLPCLCDGCRSPHEATPIGDFIVVPDKNGDFIVVPDKNGDFIVVPDKTNWGVFEIYPTPSKP